MGLSGRTPDLRRLHIRVHSIVIWPHQSYSSNCHSRSRCCSFSIMQAIAAVKEEVDAMFGNFRTWYKMLQDDPSNPNLPVKPNDPVRLCADMLFRICVAACVRVCTQNSWQAANH